MGKDYSNVMIKMSERKLEKFCDKLQKSLSDNSLDFKIRVEGKEIDITEELSCISVFMDERERASLALDILCTLEPNEVEDLIFKNYKIKSYNEYAIMNSIGSSESIYIRYLLYQTLNKKLPSCSSIIRGILFTIINRVCNNKLYGIDSSIVQTVLYWAYQNNLMQEFNNALPKGLFESKGTIISLLEDDNDITYEELLIKDSEKFGKLYYDYKMGNISKDEYRQRLVTNDGDYPTISKNASLYTSPDFSWQVVDDIVTKNFKDIDIDEKSKQIINQIFQCYYSAMYGNMFNVYELIILGLYYRLRKKDIRNTYNNKKLLEKKVVRYETKEKNYKSSIRELKKGNETLEKERDRLIKELLQRDTEIEDLKKNGVKDTTPLETELEKYKKECSDLKEKLIELERSSNKKDNIIDGLNENVRELKDKAQYFEDNNRDLKEKIDEINIANMSGSDDIPISALVNSMKYRKIAIFGGDMIHATLKNLGFRDLRLYKAGDKSVNMMDIKNCDVYVTITGYVAHSVTDTPKRASELYGIPLMNFNEKSPDKLCRDLFTFINSDKFRKN